MADESRRFAESLQRILESHDLTSAAATAHKQQHEDPAHLVFVGNWQDPCPRRLLFDPDLEAIDIVTWQHVRIHVEAGKAVAFPSYRLLMGALRVSRPTVARALAVLRLTRWLALCVSLRNDRGRFGGQVYALSDEPVPLADMLAIDDGYMRFVETAQAHRSAHVRQLASRVLGVIRDQAMAGDHRALESTTLADRLGVRLEALFVLAGDRVQNLNAVVPVKNLNTVRSSSSSSKKTTTTTNAGIDENAGGSRSAGDDPSATGRIDTDALVFPDGLSLTDSQERVLALRLEQLGTALRQDVLDEASARILAKRKTTDPVRSEFDYIARLCLRAMSGEFVLTDAGTLLRKRRLERAEAEARFERARRHSKEQGLKVLEAYEAQLAGHNENSEPESEP